MKILVVDIGGTNAKVSVSLQSEVRKIPTGQEFEPRHLVEQVAEIARDWSYEVVSIGFPGDIKEGKPAIEPLNLGRGWVGYDFAERFGKPVKMINDAAMQALGSYDGGRMLYLGLGTGLGSTLILPKLVLPLNLGMLPYRRKSLDDALSRRGLKRLGLKAWTKCVHEAIHILRESFGADYVMLGGGNSKKIENLPPGVRRGDNRNAILGGFRLWYAASNLSPTLDPAELADPPPNQDLWKVA